MAFYVDDVTLITSSLNVFACTRSIVAAFEYKIPEYDEMLQLKFIPSTVILTARNACKSQPGIFEIHQGKVREFDFPENVGTLNMD